MVVSYEHSGLVVSSQVVGERKTLLTCSLRADYDCNCSIIAAQRTARLKVRESRHNNNETSRASGRQCGWVSYAPPRRSPCDRCYNVIEYCQKRTSSQLPRELLPRFAPQPTGWPARWARPAPLWPPRLPPAVLHTCTPGQRNFLHF